MGKHPLNSIFGEGFSLKDAIKGIVIGILALGIIGTIPWILLAILQGPDTDVTSSPKYNFSSFAGTVWKTKVKVALADTKWRGRHDPTLLAPKFFDPTHPEYTPSASDKIIAVLPVGTRVRIEQLMKDNGSWGGVWVTGSLEDGKVVDVERHLLPKINFYLQDRVTPKTGVWTLTC